MSVTLKNESKRKFQIGILKDLKEFKPGEVAVFNDENAAKLLKHKGIVDVNNIKISFDETAVKDFTDVEFKETVKNKKLNDKKLADALNASKA